MQFFAKKLQNLLQILLIADKLPTFLNLQLHELVDFILTLHILLQFDLQMVYLVLCSLLLLDQVRIVLLEVRRLLLLQQWQLRLLIE